MVLGKLPVPGRPTILITVGQGPNALAVGAGGVVWTFLLSSILCLLSPSLGDGSILIEMRCLKGPLNPKQPTNQFMMDESLKTVGGGRVVRWCWVNFQCRGVLLIWVRVGQGPTVLAVGAGGDCLDIFSLVYISLLSPSLRETARYRLKYPVLQHTFVSPSAFSRRAVVSYWRKYVHEVLVNRLGGLSLPRKSVVRLTDRPDMTLDVYRGRQTTIQQQQAAATMTSTATEECLLTVIWAKPYRGPHLNTLVYGYIGFVSYS